MPRPFLDPFLPRNPPPLPKNPPSYDLSCACKVSLVAPCWTVLSPLVKVVDDPPGHVGAPFPTARPSTTPSPTAIAVTWPPSTTIGRVRITKSVLRDRDPYVLSDLIAETVHRNPTITAFHLRPTPVDYGSLVESPATCMLRDHARIYSHYMAAHPVDAEPTLASASPPPSPSPPPSARRLRTRTRLGGEETLPIYSLPSCSQWEWDGDGPGLTVPSAYAAQGLLALPVTATTLFIAHEDPVQEVVAPSPVNTECTQLSAAQHLLQRNFWTP